MIEHSRTLSSGVAPPSRERLSLSGICSTIGNTVYESALQMRKTLWKGTVALGGAGLVWLGAETLSMEAPKNVDLDPQEQPIATLLREARQEIAGFLHGLENTANADSGMHEDVASEQVDLVEINHFYDDQGRHVFDQIIFYDWSEGHNRHMVRAWRLVKNPAQYPVRDWKHGGYTALWHDNDVLRRVQSTNMRKTWTQYDPELVEREYLAKEKRKEFQAVKTVRVVKPSAPVSIEPAGVPPQPVPEEH